MASRPKNLQAALDNRRIEVARIDNAGSQWFHLTGEINIQGAGAATASVLFPVFFTEKPRFSFGAELAPCDTYTVGNMPTCSVVVLNWDLAARLDGSQLFKGATFCVVTTGPADQNMIAHWHMEGVGLRGPSAPA